MDEAPDENMKAGEPLFNDFVVSLLLNHHQNYEKRCLLILIKPMRFHLMGADTGFADFSGLVIKAHLQIRSHLLGLQKHQTHALLW